MEMWEWVVKAVLWVIGVSGTVIISIETRRIWTDHRPDFRRLAPILFSIAMFAIGVGLLIGAFYFGDSFQLEPPMRLAVQALVAALFMTQFAVMGGAMTIYDLRRRVAAIEAQRTSGRATP